MEIRNVYVPATFMKHISVCYRHRGTGLLRFDPIAVLGCVDREHFDHFVNCKRFRNTQSFHDREVAATNQKLLAFVQVTGHFFAFSPSPTSQPNSHGMSSYLKRSFC